MFSLLPNVNLSVVVLKFYEQISGNTQSPSLSLSGGKFSFDMKSFGKLSKV